MSSCGDAVWWVSLPPGAARADKTTRHFISLVLRGWALPGMIRYSGAVLAGDIAIQSVSYRRGEWIPFDTFQPLDCSRGWKGEKKKRPIDNRVIRKL